jgi:valyl-tRNA synthetase
MIQKLTGKLTQKIREYESDKGLTSENIKYVINMVLSSLDLANLSEEDKEDVLSKFESDEDMDMGDEGMGSETPEDDITSDTEVEDIQADMDVPVESEMGESDYGVGAIMDSIFGESKVDKVISKYFEVSDSEKKLQEQKKLVDREMRQKKFVKQINSIKNLSESIEQELSSKKFLEENKDYTLIGKTNKKNLVFENKKGQIKITPEGLVI